MHEMVIHVRMKVAKHATMMIVAFTLYDFNGEDSRVG
jgi:hypothetical protein